MIHRIRPGFRLEPALRASQAVCVDTHIPTEDGDIATNPHKCTERDRSHNLCITRRCAHVCVCAPLRACVRARRHARTPDPRLE